MVNPGLALRLMTLRWRRRSRTADLNVFGNPICLTIPERLTPFSGWCEHIPFAMLAVDLLKPNVIVELGTQHGVSYCAFCQAVKELNLGTRCYAIDTWQGDPHSTLYGPEVLADLRAHHDPLYGSFSRLIQSTFDEALQHFGPETIDLLHIDGYHTYEAVKHDFDAWLPRMSRVGVILLHDINVREGDFGVWNLWAELTIQYPHFAFAHGHGLGVLAVGRDCPKALQKLLGASEEDAATIRNFVFELGHRLSVRMQQRLLTAERDRLAQEVAQAQVTVQAQQQALGERERQAAELAAERDRLAQEVAQAQVTVEAQQQALGERERQAAELAAERERLALEVAQAQVTVEAQQQALGERERQAAELAAERERLAHEVEQA